MATKSPKYFSRKLAPLPVVIVRWLDAYTVDDTYTDEDVKSTPAAPTVTVGFLIADNREGVTVTTDVQLPLPGTDDKTMAYRGKHFIPRGMIVELKKIR